MSQTTTFDASAGQIDLLAAANDPNLSCGISKRVFDLIMGVAITIALSPVFLIVAAVVAAGGGPVFYSQNRIGKDGKPFRCFKFRSMVTDADKRLKELLDTDPEFKAEWEATFKSTRDPRITKIGKFLRKTSLDELPQLFNVIKGEMSLVGPRPVPHYEILKYGRTSRHYVAMRPGMTGLWQISGRNDVSYNTRVAMDRYYAYNRSTMMDLAIMFGTIRVVVFGTGAY